MSLKAMSAGNTPAMLFPPRSVRREPVHSGFRGFVITLLIVVSFVIVAGALLVRYPQKVDAFLNSDVPPQGRHVVTTSPAN